MSELKVKDKLSPQALLLAAILAEPSLIQEVEIPAIPTEAFGNDKPIFEAILSIASNGGTPSAVTVTSFFRSNGWAQGVTEKRLTALAENPPYNETTSELIRLTLEEHRREKVYSSLIGLSRKVTSGISLNEIQIELEQLGQVDMGSQIDGFAAKDLVDEAQKLRFSDQSGVNFNFPGISSIHPTFCYGHLVVVGARPKVGKSTFMQYVVHSVCVEQGIPTLWASLEDRKVPALDSLGMYMASLEKNKWGKQLTSLQKEAYSKQMERLKTVPLYVTENGSLFDIINKARQAKVKFLVLDQLSFLKINYKAEKRTYYYEEVLRIIVEECCKRLGLVVILAAQMQTKKGTHQPTLDDFKDTGSLAEKANQAIILHDPQGRHHPDRIVDLHFNRNGGAGAFKVTYNGAKGDFKDAIPL